MWNNKMSSSNCYKRNLNNASKSEANKNEAKEIKEPEESKVNYYGYCQWCNFGKHKGLTFYDIANKGDFKYLKWLKNGPHKEGFAINPNCIPHIEFALSLQDHKGALFRIAQTELDEEGSSEMCYLFEDKGEQYSSPVIQLKRCRLCNKNKNKENYSPGKDVCIRCLSIALGPSVKI